MGYEIDFLPVGEGEKSGDAIALRFGNLHGHRAEQRVVIVDGGFQADGKRMVEHVQTHYRTNEVDLVVSTHPDNDHIGGLPTVLENLRVGALWMHRPWLYSTEVKAFYDRGRIGEATHKAWLRASLETAVEVERIAKARGIPITDPFTGVSAFNECLTVLGPTKEFYCSLVPSFRDAPAGAATSGVAAGAILELLKGMARRVAETWGSETLTDECDTSAENNSSVILLLRVEGRMAMLTADVGAEGLGHAIPVLDRFRHQDPRQPLFIQIPHHGSEHNVGPTVLDRWLGSRRSSPTAERTGYVSAAKEGAPKHPAKRVVNAFTRRGVQVYATRGMSLCHFHDCPPRAGWGPVSPVPFDPNVGDD